MGDNLPNILIPVNEWVDLYSLSGITPGLAIMVENVGSQDVYLTVQDSQPAVNHDSYNVVQRGNGVRLQNAAGASGAWAFCLNENGKVAVGLAQQDGFFDPAGSGGVPSISPPNSSEDNLTGGGEFTGDWVDTTGIGIVYVSVYSDQDSAEDGLIIEQSTDGITAHFDDVFTISATRGKNFAINPHAQYLRVRYINGSVATTDFRLQTKLNLNGLASTHRIKDDITTDDDARLVKSVLSIKANDFNQYKNIERVNPMPVNGDLVYANDLSLTHSNMYGFSGSVIDLFDDMYSIVEDTSATNPKLIDIYFVRPIQTSAIGVGTVSGTFSNTVIKYGFIGVPGDVTILDESADSTLKTFVVAPSTPIGLSYIKFEFHTANTVTISNVAVGTNRSVTAQIQGVDPDGEVLAVGTSRIGNLNVGIQEYGDTSAVDAFARLRISTPYTLFDSKQLHDKQPLFWDEIVAGAATSTHNAVNANTVMTVTASASDYVIRQTKLRPNYQPGKSQLIVFTFHAPQQTGVTMQIGAFDGTGVTYQTPYNGIFLEITENNISWNIAKNGTTTESHSQGNWNYDNLDGEGPSGVILDTDAVLIAFMDIEWLGVGRVRCGFFVGGIPRYVTYFTHSNDPAFTSVYMSTPNLPLRYYIESDGTGGGTLDHICSTVISEGGIQQTGILRSVNTGSTHLDANTANTKYAIIGIRLNTTYYDITVLPEYFSMISQTNDDYLWEIQLNPVIAGTFTYTALTDSSLEYATGNTTNTITTDGIVIDSGYSKSASNIDRRIVTALTLGSTIAGVQDTFVLIVMPLSSNADYLASLTVRELL